MDGFVLGVPGFRATVEGLLARPGSEPAELRVSLQGLEDVVAAVRGLISASKR